MNESIIAFLEKQTCATVCCITEQDNPFCFTCFYAFDSDKRLLYFKSSADSFHMQLIKMNHAIAGTILSDKLNKLMVKGIQFGGIILNEPNSLTEKASLVYHKKYPLALAMIGEIRMIQINWIKMTDSTLGFGKKIIWQRVE